MRGYVGTVLNIAVKLTRLRQFKAFMAPLNLSRILSFTHFLIYYYPVILLLNLLGFSQKDYTSTGLTREYFT